MSSERHPQPDSPATTQIDDGGPAFPCHTDMVDIRKDGNKVIPVLHGGMTLRDYFAAHAPRVPLDVLFELWEKTDNKDEPTNMERRCRALIVGMVKWQYMYADEMLAARKGGVA